MRVASVVRGGCKSEEGRMDLPCMCVHGGKVHHNKNEQLHIHTQHESSTLCACFVLYVHAAEGSNDGGGEGAC